MPDDTLKHSECRQPSAIDGKIVTLLQQGDETCLRLAFDHYYKSLCLYATRYLLSYDDIEDIVQSVFISLWRNHKGKPFEGSARSYLFGAVTKTYYAEKMGLDPKDIVCVSVMPCTAKKFEIQRDDQDAAGVPDVDISITTRELARLIRKVGINFRALPEEGFDDPLGESTGAGVIFGATGGVMEAALRTAVEKLTGETLENVEFTEVRGTEGIKEATYNVAGTDVKVAVASGLSNAKVIMDKIRAGQADYHFVEIMCCPGGCVNGGGQPVRTDGTGWLNPLFPLPVEI